MHSTSYLRKASELTRYHCGGVSRSMASSCGQEVKQLGT